ncbi:hypothetical protein [[Muricauda] lutisoli]|uniref:Uncharacterized protein n=1 Tax=[Muricauda] lutisoli TaxID=2816035 RepID=A0ABS3ERU3_9FLAO|nr:hypothetical protein [[Muricauda] lutisoli]MBO0328954.1 hypothetical protein [[Muricauda] lutisoli]
MKRTYLKTIYLATLSLALITSCEKSENQAIDQKTNETIDGKAVVLGKELEIPYSADNMQVAFNNLLFNLKSKSKTSKLAKALKDAKGIEIQPSHYYYRFLPKDSAEYELLTNDTVLQVSNIPLHYEIEEEGDFYNDPELEGGENLDSFSYLYAVVPYDYTIPEHVQNEQLDNMYFAPEMDEKQQAEEGEIVVKQPINQTTKDILTVDANGEVFEYLELEALKLTNNLDEDELKSLLFYLPYDTTGTLYTYKEAHQLGYEQKDLVIDLGSVDTMLEKETLASCRKWNPSGKITVREDAINKTVGVMGAEVKVRKWGLLVIRRAYTNKNGEFRTRRTRTKRVKYAVHFKNNSRKFKIKAGNMFIYAKHRGTRKYKRKAWNQHFSYGRSKFYALVHNAAYDFYERAVGKFGLHRPNQSWLRISAKYNQLAGDHLDLNPGGRFSLIPYAEIRVGRIDDGKPMASDEIYALVTHEMTHASHYRMDRGFFINLSSAGCRLQTMAESWATGVETIITNNRYIEFNPNYLATGRIGNEFPLTLFNSHKQYREINPGSKYEYTPIVIDLVDDFNQSIEIKSTKPIDRVKNYTLSQIQTSLITLAEHILGKNGLKVNTTIQPKSILMSFSTFICMIIVIKT